MKRLLLAAALVLAAASCAQKPLDVYVPKGSMEFAGNGFDCFTLGADVHLYITPAEENLSMWSVLAVAPIRKETENIIAGLDMELTLLDDKGLHVRSGFKLEAEDLENLVPVYNSDRAVEKTVVFSAPAPEGPGRQLFTYKQAKGIIKACKNLRLSINAEQMEPVEEEVKPEDQPYTVPWLCKRYGVNNLVYQYDKAVRNGNRRRANDLEAQLFNIEKKVKNDASLPEGLRKRFVDYVEKKIDDIDDKY